MCLFLLDTDSVTEAVKDFNGYARLSGARAWDKSLGLNKHKSAVLPIQPPPDFQAASEVRCLGLFNKGGIRGGNPNTFLIFYMILRGKQRARTFQFSLSKKAYMTKCIFLAKYLYATHVTRPQAQVMQNLTCLIFQFFWGGETERLAGTQYACLRVSRAWAFSV